MKTMVAYFYMQNCKIFAYLDLNVYMKISTQYFPQNNP